MTKARNKLARHSPAYRAYQTLQRLPDDAPTFEVSDDGSLIVEMHELFCRMRNAQHQQCGERLGRKSDLKSHMRVIHHAIPKDTPDTKHSTGQYHRAHNFYISLMKDVDYPEKRTFEEEMAATGGLPNTAKPPRVRSKKRTENSRLPPSMRPGSGSDDDSDAGASTARATDGTFGSVASRSVRRRRLSPNPDESEGGGEAPGEILHEDALKANEVEDDTVETPIHHAPAAHDSKKQRRVILSPDPDESEGGGEIPDEPSYEDGQEADGVEDDAVATSMLRASATEVSKKRRRCYPTLNYTPVTTIVASDQSCQHSSEPEIKTEEQDFTLIEDDSLEAYTDRATTEDSGDIKDDITLIEDDSDDEDKKHIVLIEDDEEEDDNLEADDLEDLEFEMEEAEIKQAQLQARLEVVQLKRKMAAMKKRKAGK